jgi:hypothetical protein
MTQMATIQQAPIFRLGNVKVLPVKLQRQMFLIFFVLPLRFDEAQLAAIMECSWPNTRLSTVRAPNVRDLMAQIQIATDRSAPVLFGSFAVARPVLGSISEWWQPGDSQEWARFDALVRTRGGRVLEFPVDELPNNNDIKVIRMIEPLDDLLLALIGKS